MKKKILLCMITLAFMTLSFACSAKNNSSTQNSIISVNAKEAKKMMDSSKDYIILDVRTPDEYNEGHIKGAILIPDYEIEEKASSILKNKNQQIFVYCRSGRRSKNAAKTMEKIGYTNIVDFGGIINWPYEIE